MRAEAKIEVAMIAVLVFAVLGPGASGCLLLMEQHYKSPMFTPDNTKVAK